MGIISMVFSQSEVLQKEVYLFELLDNPTREAMMHMKAISFVRPTAENIRELSNEIREPKFGQYHLCTFSSPHLLLLLSDSCTLLQTHKTPSLLL